MYRKNSDGQIEEVVGDSRLRLLNRETGDVLSANEMKRAMIRDYFLDGGGYAYVNWKGVQIDGLYYIESRHVGASRGTDVIFKNNYLTIQGKTYDSYEFIKLLRNTSDGVTGRSIIKDSDKAISVGYNTIVFEENLVRTGGNKKGFVKSTKRLTQEAINRLKESWSKMYSNSSENVVVLNDGLEFQEAGSTSVEMQLNANKEANTSDICKLFNVPPAMITGGASEQDESNFIKFCIIPLISKMVSEFNRVLLLEDEKETYYFEADIDDLVKGDIEKRFNAYKTGVETGWLQVDEIREKENMTPLGMNFVKLGLSDVLYDPTTGEIYTPNTNQLVSMKKGGIQGQE